MYIDRLILNNIRGFETLDFKLVRPDHSYAGWTVFTGDNGSGKSTLLKAIALALVGRDTARALQPSFQGWIRHGAPRATGSIQLEVVGIDTDDQSDAIFPARIELKNGSKEPSLQTSLPKGKPRNYQQPERTIWSNDTKGWFSCGYGPFRRIFGASSDAMKLMLSTNTARYATMFQEAASLSETERWLRDLQFKALEKRIAEREQLQVILALLNDELMPNHLRVARVDSDGLWLVDRNGVELSWHEMSEGYRSIIALLIDILHHMIDAYGIEGLTQRDDRGMLYITRSGVILIDEVDTHLHPEWQREIGFWLKRRFPKIQFLVTTHSPIICQAADPNGLFVLPEPGSDDRPYALSDEDYRRIIASRPDTILLTPAFGLQNTRSPKVVHARSEYAHLKAKERSVKLNTFEQHRLEQLQPLIHNNEEQ